MPALLAGLVVLGLLIFLVGGYSRADVGKVVKSSRFSGGVLLALLTIVFIVTDRFAFALLTGGGAWVLLFRTVPPWHRPDFGLGAKSEQTKERSGVPSPAAMSRAEALKVLGLEENASHDEIRASHRRLILQIHPDKGGTNYLAAKINEAKDVLLSR